MPIQDVTKTCPECGVLFTGHPNSLNCGKPECKKARRRRIYAGNSRIRTRAQERARAFAKSERGKALAKAALQKRIEEGRAPWYTLPAKDLPKPLAELMRVYRKYAGRARGGKDVETYERLKVLLRAARGIHEWSTEDYRTLEAELRNVGG